MQKLLLRNPSVLTYTTMGDGTLCANPFVPEFFSPEAQNEACLAARDALPLGVPLNGVQQQPGRRYGRSVK